MVWASSAVGSHHGVTSYLRVSGAATALAVSVQRPGRCALLVPSGPGSQRAGRWREKPDTPSGLGGANPGAKIQLNVRTQWVCTGPLADGVHLERGCCFPFPQGRQEGVRRENQASVAPASCACMCVCMCMHRCLCACTHWVHVCAWVYTCVCRCVQLHVCHAWLWACFPSVKGKCAIGSLWGPFLVLQI